MNTWLSYYHTILANVQALGWFHKELGLVLYQKLEAYSKFGRVTRSTSR